MFKDPLYFDPRNEPDWEDLEDLEDAEEDYYDVINGPDPDLAYDMAREERLFGI